MAESFYSQSNREHSYCANDDEKAVQQDSCRPDWQKKHDTNQVYNLKQKFSLTSHGKENLKEIKRWRDNDLKGRRSNYYIKEVLNQNVSILAVVPQTRLERAHNYTDGHKCLNTRKAIMKCRIHVSEMAHAVTSSKYFEGFIILVIGLNCITLAGSDSTKEETPTEKNIDLVFNIIYTVEMFLRIFSLGFVLNEGAYLRSMWCQLDFICVCTAFLEYVGGGGSSLGALRAFRVLRPLRFVNNIQGLKSIVQSIMAAIPVLKDTIIVLFFFFLIFAIGGLNLFMGLLKQQCVDELTGQSLVDEEGTPMLCGNVECPAGYYCGKKTLNPNNDVTNFDNIFWALLNVFQCITLEGWSEIMVMYQKAYTPWTFFFFVPMVFIGAFFLLNLNLAVIQTKYSETQMKQKEKKEKERLELEHFAQAMQTAKPENQDDFGDDEQAGDSSFKISVAEYFIAKRAAIKMKAFWMHYQAKKAREDAALKQREHDEKNVQKKLEEANMFKRQALIRRRQSLQSSPALRNSASPKNRKQSDSKSNQSGANQEEDKVMESNENTEELEDQVRQVMDKAEQRRIKQEKASADSICEEENEQSEDYDRAVRQFLMDVNTNEIKAENEPSQVGRNKPGQNTIKQMAFHDPRILSRSRATKIYSSMIDRSGQESQLKFQSLKKNKFSQLEIYQDNVDTESVHNKMLNELDFDKVIAQRQLSRGENSDAERECEETQDKKEGNLDYISDINHPLDLSFSHENKRAEYRGELVVDASDKEFGRQKSSSQEVNSISLSEDSAVNRQTKQQDAQDSDDDNPFYQAESSLSRSRNLRKQRQESEKRYSQDMRRTLNRVKTLNLLKQGDKCESESTFQGGFPSAQQQIDVMSNFHREPVLKPQRSHRSLSTMKPAETQQNPDPNILATVKPILVNDALRVKQEKLKIYQDIDRYHFTSDKPDDPKEFINQQTEKCTINPGVQYVSTSQNEIFEIRNKVRQKQYLSKKNPFIAPPQDENEANQLYKGSQDDTYIRSYFDSYQLKTIYRIKDQAEVELDSDDEDALIFQPQPYETTVSVGYKDFLNHLTTKFIARRSDIIVSSTLSITLTPVDDQVEPAHFATVDSEAIWNYVMLRNEYRATLVESNRLPNYQARRGQSNANFRNILSSDDNDDQFEQDLGGSSSDDNTSYQQNHFLNACQEDEDQNCGENEADLNESQKKQTNEGPFYLPETLLSEELDKRLELRLNSKQRRMYTAQKTKYESKLKRNEKRLQSVPPIPLPKDEKWDLKKIRLLIAGQFKFDDDDEEDEDEVPVGGAKDKNGLLQLGRATLVGGQNEPQYELNLEAFDKQLTAALQQQKLGIIANDPRLLGDNVPAELKVAFNLPNDMSNYEIDFQAVRNDDAKFKKSTPVWSGQDVLEINLDKAKSEKILLKMNQLRVWPKGIQNKIKKFRAAIKHFTRMSIFNAFLTTCVLINTIGMAMDSYDIDVQTAADLEFMNLIFTWIFIIEMTLKLLAIGPKKYSNEVMNLLDGGVVTLSIVEMIMSALGGGSGAGSLQAFRTIRVFRTFRVLRVTRLLRGLQSMAMVIRVIGRSFMDFILITILMFVFIFIYTLLGRQVFQGQYDFGADEELPRANYETFAVAFVTVFQVLTMENWQQVLFASMRASNNNPIFKTVTAIYYISWIFIGNFILLNLFLAILIDAFNTEDDEEEVLTDVELRAAKRQRMLEIKKEKQRRLKRLGTSANQIKQLTQSNEVKKKKKTERSNFTGRKQLREEDLEDIDDMTPEEIRSLLVRQGLLKAQPKDQIDKKEVEMEIEADRSLYLFHRTSCFRRNIHYIQKHKYFERFIMLLIGLSSVKLALESYFREESGESSVLQFSEKMDTVFNHCFNLECVLKIIALGFAMDQGSYLRDSWNKLDFFIVVTSNIDMMLANTDIPALKVLRMLRMIRPLRVISHNPQLKMIVAALAKSVAPISNVAVIVMIIWLMFAIYGMNTFMGMFFYCSENPYVYNTKWVCQDHGGEWKKFDSNFDDIGQSMTTLFILASLEGWPDIMYQAIDVTRRDNGPKYEASPAQSGFFIVFIMIGSFFFLNFFIGVLFLEYEKAEKNEKKGFSPAMIYWKELQRLIIEAKVPHELRYKPQDRGTKLKLYSVVTSDPFDIFIMVCIVLNMFQMALDHEGASPGMMNFLKITNYFFTAVFFLECMLKLYVYRKAYFKTGWNKFDFFVVSSSIIDLGLEFALPTPEGGQEDSSSQILSVGPQLARVLRVLRVSRVLRLAGKAKGLQALLKTIMMSVDSLFNVFILLMLIFFISAVLGNTMFFNVYEGDVIDEFKNFTNFHQSFSLLFSISTGEDWNKIMYDTMRVEPDCTPGRNCGSPIAPVFFLTFIMIVTNVMLNLFILVIIQNFTKYQLEDDNPLSTFEQDFEDFVKAWKQPTSNYQCMKIKPKHVPGFLRNLPNRMKNKLGIFSDTSLDQINKIVLKMDIKIDYGPSEEESSSAQDGRAKAAKIAESSDGFIFFNEMLYRVMRSQYVTYINLKFNRAMTVEELITQYKISEITFMNKQEKKLTKEQKEDVFMSQIKSAPVNLFLTRMFYKASFKAWHKLVNIHIEKRDWDRKQQELQRKAQQIGQKYELVAFQEKSVETKEILCEWDEESVYTLSDDEAKEFHQNDDEDKSLRSVATIKKFAHAESFKREPDEVFRKNAAVRMSSSKLKYPMLMAAAARDLNSPQPNFNSPHKLKQAKTFVLAAGQQIDEVENEEQDASFVNPNSTAYQKIVLEQKINKHQSSKNVYQLVGSSLSLAKYAGQFQQKNSELPSPLRDRINDPLWKKRASNKSKLQSPTLQ